MPHLDHDRDRAQGGPAREPHHGYDPVQITQRRAGWEAQLATARQPGATRVTRWNGVPAE